jgi:predicted nucleic acid-binding protein
VSKIVVDASVAMKWVVEEIGTREALALLNHLNITAPDLIVAECANVLWKKVRRGELSREQALLAAGLLERADLELLPTRNLLEAAARIAIELDHPAYDCVYLALASANDLKFVTADESFARKVRQMRRAPLRNFVMTLSEAPSKLGLGLI